MDIQGYKVVTKNTTYLLYRADNGLKILAISPPRTPLSLSALFQTPIAVQTRYYPPKVGESLYFDGVGSDWPLRKEDGGITTTRVREVIPLTVAEVTQACLDQHKRIRGVTT